jgi:hypothetical protein
LKQRIHDILAIVQAMHNDPALRDAPIALAARGRLTVPAFFAFAGSSQINSLYLAGGLVSYRNILNTENYRQPLSNFVWDLFRLTDLPKLAAQAKSRRMHLAGAVDAANKRVDAATLRTLYPGTNVEISAEPNWEENALSSL